MSKKSTQALSLMVERFGHDTLISIATLDGNRPAVRIVNSYYEDGSFYTVTYALSNKMKQIKRIPRSPYAENGLLHTVLVKIPGILEMRRMRN